MAEAVGSLVVLVGCLMMAVGGLWFVIAAFREHVLWGIGVLVFPVVSLVFLILGWPEAKRPFCLQLLGLGVVLFGILVLAARLPFTHH